MRNEEIICNFENDAVPEDSFHHADHVRLAFAYLCEYPVLQALEKFASALKRFATARGKTQLYNETITWALMLLIRERMARAGHQQVWVEFAAHNPDLFNWKDSVLKKYYREETLASELAKGTFLFPDKVIPCP